MHFYTLLCTRLVCGACGPKQLTQFGEAVEASEVECAFEEHTWFLSLPLDPVCEKVRL